MEVLRAGSYEEACEAVKRVDPRAWVNNGDRIRDNLRYSYNPLFPTYQDRICAWDLLVVAFGDCFD